MSSPPTFFFFPSPLPLRNPKTNQINPNEREGGEAALRSRGSCFPLCVFCSRVGFIAEYVLTPVSSLLILSPLLPPQDRYRGCYQACQDNLQGPQRPHSWLQPVFAKGARSLLPVGSKPTLLPVTVSFFLFCAPVEPFLSCSPLFSFPPQRHRRAEKPRKKKKRKRNRHSLFLECAYLYVCVCVCERSSGCVSARSFLYVLFPVLTISDAPTAFPHLSGPRDSRRGCRARGARGSGTCRRGDTRHTPTEAASRANCGFFFVLHFAS